MNRPEKNHMDRRTKYTRNLIKEVLMAFLKERRFETITVTEICRRAEINRGTFYLHYLDTYNVLEDLVDDFLSETTDTVQCKCQYKNVGKVENKNVGFSTHSSAA